MEINIEKIEQSIIADAVDNLVSSDDLRRRLDKAIDGRISKYFTEVGDAQIREAVVAAVKDGFERSYQPVDAFGKPEGKKTSIKDRLNELVSAYWTQRVDQHGKPTDSTWGKVCNRAEWMMTQICAADFSDAMKQEVVNATALLKDGLRATLRGHLDKILSEVFHVKSADDQKEDRR